MRLPSTPSTFPIAWLAIASAAIVAFYSGSYGFMYFPITEGWLSVYVQAFKHGAFVYKDINLLLPPAYPIMLFAIDSVFGDGFWVLRLVGVFLMAAIGAVTFDILRFIFDRWVSAFAAIVAVIYYESGNAFIDYDFTQFVTFYMLLGCLCVVRYARSGKGFLLFLSAFFLALATLTKQSNGGIVSIGMTPVAICAALYVAPKSLTKHAMLFVAGALSPLAAVLSWLAYNGAAFEFFDQTVFHAASAKGSSAIFSGWIWRLFVDADFAGANLAALFFVGTTVFSMVVIVIFIDAVKSAYFAANSRSDAPAKMFAHSFLGASLAQPRSWNPRAFAARMTMI